MIRFFLFLIWIPSITIAQIDTVPLFNGEKVLLFEKTKRDSTKLNITQIGGNPRYIPDQIRLDSLNRVISEKRSTNQGYVYYNWNSNGTKTQQEVFLDSLGITIRKFFSGSGMLLAETTENHRNRSFSTIFYDKTSANGRIEMIVESVAIENRRNKRTETSYHTNGQVKHHGTYTITPVLGDTCRIGEWQYFDFTGKIEEVLKYQECTISE